MYPCQIADQAKTEPSSSLQAERTIAQLQEIVYRTRRQAGVVVMQNKMLPVVRVMYRGVARPPCTTGPGSCGARRTTRFCSFKDVCLTYAALLGPFVTILYMVYKVFHPHNLISLVRNAAMYPASTLSPPPHLRCMLSDTLTTLLSSNSLCSESGTAFTMIIL